MGGGRREDGKRDENMGGGWERIREREGRE